MFNILESESGKPFKVKGIAMKKDVSSKNGFHYSGALVEGIVNTIRESINNNGSYPISMMADHPGVTSNKVLSLVGKITDMYMDGNNAIVEAEIANTSVGKDVQELIKGKFLEGLSIRASNAKYKTRNIDGKMVKDVLEMDLKGVDLVVNSGVDGARITDIIESDQSSSENVYLSVNESFEIKDEDENPNQDINEEETKLDLAKLKEQYPELVESLKQEFKTLLESENQTNTLQESFDKISTEKEALETKLQESEKTVESLQESETALKTELESVNSKLKEITESEASAKRESFITTSLASLKFADSVKDALRKKVELLESEEEITKVLESETEFINLAIKASTGIDLSGKGHTGDNGKKITEAEEDDFITKVMCS